MSQSLPSRSTGRRAAAAPSLERSLPLLISGLLSLVLVLASWAAYREVKHSAKLAAAERL